MIPKRILISVGSLVLFLIAISTLWLTTQARGQVSTAVVQNVPYDVRVETDSEIITAGMEATVRIRVAHNGKPVDINESGRLLHVMIVSANLCDAFHTYAPTRVAAGVYEVPHTFSEAGRYRIWTEVDNTAAEQRHDQYAEQIAYAEITVEGAAALEPVAAVTEKTVGSYQVRLVTAPIVAGKPTTLRVEVRDKTGKTVPLGAAEPFLYFMSGENFTFFRHGHGHSLPDGSGSLENIFPIPGRYVFWVQLEGENIDGIQVPFILAVS